MMLSVLSVVFAVACKRGDAEVDSYVNTKMAVPLARLADGTQILRSTSGADANKPETPARLRHAATTLHAASAEMAAITPPKAFITAHRVLVENAEALATSTDDLAAAATARDDSTFTRTFVAMNLAIQSYIGTSALFETLVKEAGVTAKTLPPAPAP